METPQSWVTCFLTDILLTYLEEQYRAKAAIDYAALFRGADGFVAPPDPQTFLPRQQLGPAGGAARTAHSVRTRHRAQG